MWQYQALNVLRGGRFDQPVYRDQATGILVAQGQQPNLHSPSDQSAPSQDQSVEFAARMAEAMAAQLALRQEIAQLRHELASRATGVVVPMPKAAPPPKEPAVPAKAKLEEQRRRIAAQRAEIDQLRASLAEMRESRKFRGRLKSLRQWAMKPLATWQRQWSRG